MPAAQQVELVAKAGTEEAVERVLERLELEAVPAVLARFDELPQGRSGQLRRDLIRRHFGLYWKDLSPKGRAALSKRLANGSALEVLRHTLDAAGIEHSRADGTLDYAAIHRMLRYDLAVGFTGGAYPIGDHVFTVMAILERTHQAEISAEMRAQLNSKDAQDRAQAWAEFLLRKKLVEPLPVSMSIER